MERIRAPKISRPPKRPHSTSSTVLSDRAPRETKTAPYQDPRYDTQLKTLGIFMHESTLGISAKSADLCQEFLKTGCSLPGHSLFSTEKFKLVLAEPQDMNEARIVRDMTPLIVPPASWLYSDGDQHLGVLKESLDHCWINSIPLAGPQPQPDYSVGFKREAFTEDQLSKLAPCIGEFLTGDRSLFMATYYVYFLFLACEVKSAASHLNTADRQNAHSMTLAVRAVVELFRAVKREAEVSRQVLAFSISHNHNQVNIYGHYAEVDGEHSKYYRHEIRSFSISSEDGKDKWTAYQFTRNVYDTWMPMHFQRICSAIDQLPSDGKSVVASQAESTPSQDPESMSRSVSGSHSRPVSGGAQSCNVGQENVATIDTSSAGPTSQEEEGKEGDGFNTVMKDDGSTVGVSRHSWNGARVVGERESASREAETWRDCFLYALNVDSHRG